MHQFNESHPAFSGFSKYYERELFPQLKVWERKRLNKRIWAALGMSLSTIWCAFVIYWMITTSEKLHSYIAVSIIVVSNPLLVYHLFFSNFKDEVKDFLVSKVCSFTGLKYARRANGAG